MSEIMKGTAYVGLVKQRAGQEKKHVTQMTFEEKTFLLEQIKNINPEKVHISEHLKRKNEVSFNLDDILSVLACDELASTLLEYNETVNYDGLDKRVLLRSNTQFKTTFSCFDGSTYEDMGNLCFVISIKTSEIITAYWNRAKDSHRTVDWSRYTQGMKIIN